MFPQTKAQPDSLINVSTVMAAMLLNVMDWVIL